MDTLHFMKKTYFKPYVVAKCLVRDLKEGDLFKFYPSSYVYLVLETSPSCYVNSIRVKGKSITFPLCKDKFVIPITNLFSCSTIYGF